VKVAYICGFVGFTLLGWACGANPFGYAFFLVGMLAGVGALIHWIYDLKWGGKYSLKALERVDREERRRAIEDELDQIDSAGNAICLNCGTHFDPILNLCPRCGKSLFNGPCR
jgi:hypothetical protein